MTTNTAYQADVFIGTTLNFFDLAINDYPISFIIWNIGLALLAVWLGYWSAKIYSSDLAWYKKLGAVLLWLAIFPNAAYLMTDARHIIGYCPLASYGRVCAENAWMTLFFFAFGAIGWPAFVLALRPMKIVVAKKFGRKISWLFALVMCWLAALGILLGLVNRFNSWNIVTNLTKVFKTATTYFYEPQAFFNLLMSFIILFLLYAVGEKIFVKTPK